MSIKTQRALYWTTTAFIALIPCLAGGVVNLLHLENAVRGMDALGYPAYVLTIIGAWKVLAGLALLAPRLPRIKEWAYAGLAFDFTGAAFSHAAVGDPPGKVIAPLVLLGIAFASWALRPASRKLGAAAGESQPANTSAGSPVAFASREPSGAL